MQQLKVPKRCIFLFILQPLKNTDNKNDFVSVLSGSRLGFGKNDSY